MRVLITGVTGQDGSYLAEHLAAEGHEVWGMVHRGQRNTRRAWIQQLVPSLKLTDGDLLDQSSLQRCVSDVMPDVVYNLGALTFVGTSWQQPTLMSEVTGLGCLRLLEAVRQTDRSIRVVQASTSEQFGAAPAPQSEATPFLPRSPYGVAKLYAHWMATNYRDSYRMHVSTAIMFNHESPRRPMEFVTRKVTRSAAWTRAALDRGDITLRSAGGLLWLGMVTSERDWGWAPDYVRALPLMAEQDEPSDYVLATGESHTVLELVDLAYGLCGLDWHDHLRYDPLLLRPAEVEHLRGDATRAREVLGWAPTMTFQQIVRAMVDADLRQARAEPPGTPREAF